MTALLVTGGTGFIGGALLRHLSNSRDYCVRAAVRSNATSVPPGMDIIQFEGLEQDTDWGEALSGISVVIHAAARVHVMKDNSVDPLSEFRRINVEATLDLARQAVQAGVQRFVFISTIGVHGDSSLRPLTEDDEVNPVEAFAVAKLEAEIGLQTLAAETGMELTIIRSPLVYGPSAPGNFGRLVNLVARGVPLPFGSVKNNCRSLVALDNLIDLILTCLKHPAAADQVFFAGDGHDLSTTELLQKIALAMGKPSRLMPVPVYLMKFAAILLRKNGVMKKTLGTLQADITKARELLGWNPPVSVDEGMKRAVAPLVTCCGNTL